MAKVLLINPQAEIGKKVKGGIAAPLGLLSIGSYVIKRGYSVKIINTILENDPMRNVLDETKEAKYIGLSVMTAQITHALIMSEKLKSLGKIIIWGGIHGELFPKQTCEDSAIDYVICGEGEATFFELIDSLEKGKSVENIPGLVHKKENKVIVNPPRKPLPVEAFSDIDYGLLDLERKFKKKRMLEFETSRGCPYRCGFCIDTIGWRHNWRSLPAETVLNDLEKMKDKYKIEEIIFREENFFVNQKRAEKIIEGMIKKGLNIKWSTNIRAEYFKDDYVNDEFMTKLKKSGLTSLTFGVESGSERVRGYMKKGITSEQVFRAVSYCKKHDIHCNITFMVGYPTETKKEIFETINMINKIIKIHPDVTIRGPVPFMPLPGASIYQYCLDCGFKEPKTLREWSKREFDLLSYFKEYCADSNFLGVDKKDRYLIENIGKYSTLATSSWGRIMSFSPLLILPTLLCKIRWKLKFFRFPIDYKLYKWVTKKLPVY